MFLEVWRKILIEGIIGKFKRMEGRGGEQVYPHYLDILKIKNRIRERNDHINSQLLQSFANLKRKREKRKEKKEKEKIEIDNFIFFLIKVGEDHQKNFFFGC